MLRVDEGEH